MPNIEEVKRQYEKVSSSLESYMIFAAPGGILRNPNSLSSGIMYSLLESSITAFQRTLYSSQGTITYVATPINLKEPQLVVGAKAALGNVASAPNSVTREVGKDY